LLDRQENLMTNQLPANENPSIQDNLYQLSIQLGHPLDLATVEQLYQNARDLLSHITPTPVTLARVAGCYWSIASKIPQPRNCNGLKTRSPNVAMTKRSKSRLNLYIGSMPYDATLVQILHLCWD
jgi:hypothetical protein